jgi:hypothetical protein
MTWFLQLATWQVCVGYTAVWSVPLDTRIPCIGSIDLQAWFTEELKSGTFSPTTPAAQLDSADVMTPFTPSAFPAFLSRSTHDEHLRLPLSREMAM